MINETQIDQITEKLADADFDQILLEIKRKYPLIHSYLLNEQLALLSEDEYQLLWFDAVVILQSFESFGQIPEQFDQEVLEEHESSNWAKFENSKPAGFREKLDDFFNETDQEDLLAFVEDTLVDDDEMPISSAAKEIIFITLKSIIDLLNDGK